MEYSSNIKVQCIKLTRALLIGFATKAMTISIFLVLHLRLFFGCLHNFYSASIKYNCSTLSLSFSVYLTGAPDIQNDYFTSGAGPGTSVVTARSDRTPIIRPIIDQSDVDDRSQISTRVLIKLEDHVWQCP